MKRIQPFTIGTKLSVPAETKGPDYVGIVLPVPAVDCCDPRHESNDDTSPFCEERQSTSHNSASVEELSEDDVKEEDVDSASPSASSRSIRKIAMCGNQINHHVSNTISSERNMKSSAGALLPVEKRLRDASSSQLETDSWTKGQKMKNLHSDFSRPTFSHDHAEDASHSQRRDLKGFENFLIQLTASLDMSQEPQNPLQKKTETGDLGLETLRRRRSAPEEHTDKLWLKLRSLLRDHHHDLMLALEVSSFYQQADNIIRAVHCKKNSLTDVHRNSQDKGTNEIACQINMLDEAASRLSQLHPTLARRVSVKQAEVKENWTFVLELLRNQKADVCSKSPPSSASDLLTTCPDSQSFARNDALSVTGKDVKEEQNRLRGFECSQNMWAHRMRSPVEECSVGSRGSLSENSCSRLDSISEKQDTDVKSCISRSPETTHTPSNLPLIPRDSTTSRETVPLRLKDNTNGSDGEDCDLSKQSQEHKLEELLSQVKFLWDVLQKKYGENDEMKPAIKETTKPMPECMTQDFPLSYHLPEGVEEESSGMLAKFLELLDPSSYHKINQDVLKSHSETAEATETSLDLLGDQTDGGRSEKFDQTTEELQISLSTLTLRINQHLSRCAELSTDLLDMETDLTVLCDSDLSAVDGLQEQQDDLEAHFHIIEGEVKEMEKLAGQLQVSTPEQRDPVREEIQAILQAWEEVGRNMAENRARLEKFHQIQNYFENYFALITWTENTRSCFLTGKESGESDRSIREKLDQLNSLSAAAQTMGKEDAAFQNIIKERTDELQSMLGWIRVNWQRRQTERRDESSDSDQLEVLPLKTNLPDGLCIANTEGAGGSTEMQPSENTSEQLSTHGVSDVSQESCLSKTSLGSSICLILSFDEKSTGINQVTKQWSPSSSESHCIKNDVTVATEDRHMESTCCVEMDSSGQQPQDNSSVLLQQSQEVFQVRWPNESFVSEESELEVLALKNNQVQSVLSPNKETVSSGLFPDNIKHPSSSVSEGPQSPNDNPSQLSSDAVQTQELQLSITHQQQSQQSQDSTQTQQSSSKNQSTGKNEDLQHDVAAEITHRVFTYLHVSDSYKSADRAVEAVYPALHATPEDAITPTTNVFTHPPSIPACDVTPEGGAVGSRNRFKASSVFTLKEPIRGQESEQRRRSTLGIVGLERSGKSSSIFRRRCNTWPEEEKREIQSHSKLQVFVKNNSIMADSVMGDKTNSVTFSSKTPRGTVKNMCSYLSMGSTLSFRLPKRFHSVSDLENREEIEPAMIYHNTSDLINQSGFTPDPEMQTEAKIHTEQTEVDSHSKVMNKEDLEDTAKPGSELETQQLEDSTEPVVIPEEVQITAESPQRSNKDLKYNPVLNSPEDPVSQHKTVSLVLSVSPCSPLSQSSVCCGQKCPSVHTKIKDLKSHLYCISKNMQINSPANVMSQRSTRVFSCRVRDCAVCQSDAAEDAGVCAGNPDISTEGVLQPGHWLFQQEEEELEDIWRGRANCTVEINMDEEKGL